MSEEKLSVEFSYDFDKGNYIRNVYYVTETDAAILVVKDNIGSYEMWIPKSLIKFGWKADKQYPQNIYIKWAPPDFHWKRMKDSTYLE